MLSLPQQYLSQHSGDMFTGPLPLVPINTRETSCEKKEWDKRVKEREANGASGSNARPRVDLDQRRGDAPPTGTVAGKPSNCKPICSAYMLGNCTKGNDCPNHHAKALATRITKRVDQSLRHGTNLLKPTTAVPGETPSSADSTATPQAKTNAQTKSPNTHE